MKVPELVKPTSKQMSVPRLPEDGAEAPDEVRLGEMGHRGHGADVERLGVGALHGVAGERIDVQPLRVLLVLRREGQERSQFVGLRSIDFRWTSAIS